MKTPKLMTVKLSEIVRNADGSINVDWNHRDKSEAGYDLKPLMNEIESASWQKDTKALKTAPVLLKTEQGYRILQGHRRLQAIEALGWDEVKATVYDELTDIQRMSLIMDQGNQKRISKAELFNAVCHCLDASMTEVEIVATLRGLLMEHFPRGAKEIATFKDDQGWLNSYRGVVQGLGRPWKSPYVVKDAYYAKLQDKQRWPSDTEVKECLKVFEDERKENPQYTKLNPGPKFLAKWKDVQTTREAAASEDGKNRPKTGSMLTRTQIEELQKNEDSGLGKIYLLRVLNKITPDYFAAAKKIALRLEQEHMTDDEKDNCLLILKSAGSVESETPGDQSNEKPQA